MVNHTGTGKNIFPFKNLSIQKRLPLLMCLLLLVVATIFIAVSYIGMRNTALNVGKERLRSVTSQIGGMLAQSVQSNLSATKSLIGKDTVHQFLQKRDEKLTPAIAKMLEAMKRDSTWNAVALLDTRGKTILQSNEPVLPFEKGLLSFIRPADSIVYGNMNVINGTTYFPVSAKIRSGTEVLGYLVSWRYMPSNKRGMEQISALMGFKGTLFIGNNDGSTWTDMVKATSHVSIDTQKIGQFHAYDNLNGENVIAATEYIPSTTWLVLLEFSKTLIIEPATRFLKTLILISFAIILLGTFIAWLMSRNIIRPLNHLTDAASSITSGNFSNRVEVIRKDEVGELAIAFNAMAEAVQMSQLNLERQVADRTSELQKLNREMEAFTYSVSHDLRAPLRGIIGFTTILQEDYGSKLDDEGKRIAGVIKNNALKLGVLIDDLLNFSRLGRQPVVKTKFNTNAMVKDVIREMNANGKIEWVVRSMPDSTGDANTIRQVWINLISNAVKYSSKTDLPKIEIGFSSEEKEKAFYVKDNGAGFDSRFKNKLFKVFQRLHSANEFEGTGVGLAIVEKIISKHGGKVWAEGEINQGATFYFTLSGSQA